MTDWNLYDICPRCGAEPTQTCIYMTESPGVWERGDHREKPHTMRKQIDTNLELQRLRQQIRAYKDFCRAAGSLLAEYGWEPFGTHAGDNPSPGVEFSKQVGEEDGLPVFERINNIKEEPELGD